VLARDAIAYRVEGGLSGRKGRYYGLTKPANAIEADLLYSVSAYGNEMTEVCTYLVGRGTVVWEGPVSGGAGVQWYISDRSRVILLRTEVLSQH
jgi:hypothetical protein